MSSRVTSLVVGAMTLGVGLAAQTVPPPQTPPPVPPPQITAGQTPTPTPPQTLTPPRFNLATDLVRLDVSVLDKSRRPVRGLTASDFTILENGKPQSVAAFTAVNVPAPVTPSAPWMRDVAPDVRDNSDAQQRRLFIIAIDDATIENDAQALKGMKEAARGVIDRLGPADLASVVFTRDNRNSQDFTSDRARLLRAVDGFTLGFRGQGGAVTAATNASMALAGGGGKGGGMVGGGGGPAADTSDDLWYLYSVGVLDRAVEYLTDVADRRKSIVYIGEGIPFDLNAGGGSFNATPGASSGGASMVALQARIKDQMDDIFDRAARANVTIYSIDPCGLRKDPPPSVQGARAIPLTCVRGHELDYIENIASSTGGRAIINTADFGPGLDAVFDENSQYYLIGFQPADPAKDGKFRKVEVKVNRPGLEVRTRSGYDAPREEVATDRPKPAANPLMKAIAGVVPKSDLPMQITGAPFAYVGPPVADKPAADVDPNPAAAEIAKAKAKKEDKKKKDKDEVKPDASVVIAVGFRQPIRQSDERVVENVDLQVAAYNADGRSFGNFRQRADVVVRPGSTGMAEYEVFGQIDLKPGRYQLRVAANLNSFADSGSVYFDVDVPDFAVDALSMSGMLLTSTPTPQYAPKNGMKPTVPVIPTTRRVFSATHTVAAFTRVYQGSKAKLGPVSARLIIRDSKDAVVVERKQDMPVTQFRDTRFADLQIDVPIAELPKGDYVLTIETKAGTNVVTRDCRFSVVK